jgi:hypothetical protein
MLDVKAEQSAIQSCRQTSMLIAEIGSSSPIHSPLTPQKPQKNHTGQQFWPNYLHGLGDSCRHFGELGVMDYRTAAG